MIYFDNAATTHKKPRNVYSALKKTIRNASANPGRSGHRLSLLASDIVYEAREIIANHFSYPYPENIVFTYNATYALNMAIKTIIKPGSHIIISDIEHNSVLRPIESLCNNFGVSYSVFNSKSNNVYLEIEGLINDKTSAIVSTIASNVTGDEISLFMLSELKRKHNLNLIIDASQSAGHNAIFLKNILFDAFIAPAHKSLFGIMGLGFCIFNSTPDITFIEGGSGSDSININMPDALPERMEGGTVALPAIASLSEGIKFIDKIGVNEINHKLSYLMNELKCRLSTIKDITLYGGNNGILSFNIRRESSEKIAKYLDTKGISVRAGLHCAPLAHRGLGTIDIGAVRVSLSYFNKIREIDALYKILKQI